MSKPDPDWSPEDRATVAAVVRHHSQLAQGLNQRTESLLGLTETAQPPATEQARQDLLNYLRTELLPHAHAEEQTLYPAAAAQPAGALLVEGMLDEHRLIVALVDELAADGSPVRTAAAARALAAVFATHLTKENDLVLPLLAGADDVSLADLLAGMHEVLGDGAHAAGEASGTAGGCGCGEDGCGGASAPAEAAALSIDARLDVRDIPHGQRHAVVLSAVGALAPGEALVLVAPHAPRPVLAEVDAHYTGQIQTQWLQSGPEVWQVRLHRVHAEV